MASRHYIASRHDTGGSAIAAKQKYAIIEAPSVLGLKPTGVEKLGARLLELGLARRIGARTADVLDVPRYDDRRDAVTLTLNARAIADWSPVLADAVEAVLEPASSR